MFAGLLKAAIAGEVAVAATAVVLPPRAAITSFLVGVP